MSHIDIVFRIDEEERCLWVEVGVKTQCGTGCEMEAIVGVMGSLVCVYDMCKAVDKSMVIGNVELIYKTGGKSGVYDKR